jgi:acyl-CoA dehydrogenase
VFARPIGQNQGVQFPIARAHVNVEAANLMRVRAAELFDRGEACGAEANMASCSPPMRHGRPRTSASRRTAASASPRTTTSKRKFRETRLYQVAPISTNLILAYVAEHVLGLPRRISHDCLSISSHEE